MAEEVLGRFASDRDPAMVAISWICGKYRFRPTGELLSAHVGSHDPYLCVLNADGCILRPACLRSMEQKLRPVRGGFSSECRPIMYEHL